MAKFLAAVLLLQSWIGFTGGWSAFKDAHLQPSGQESSGQVIDDNNGITHSEGQSYGMLLATAAGDRATFDAIWTWTRANLRRPDGLFAWKWQDGRVQDRNNASDADIVIAWALLRAAKLWDTSYAAEAQVTIAAIRQHLILDRPDPADPGHRVLLLLPGLDGFQRADGAIVLNPSYWIFPAFDAFAESDDAAFWHRVAESGQRLTDSASMKAAAGKSGLALPADWLTFPGLTPAPDFPPRASYDAMRVPLWLIWSGRSSPCLAAWQALWHDRNKAWIDLVDGTAADYAPGVEQQAMLALIERAAVDPPAGNDAPSRTRIPAIDRTTRYFPAALDLLAQVAWAEIFGGDATSK